MILVLGGLASGKRTFAQRLGIPASEIAFDVHEAVAESVSLDELVEQLVGKEVVTCAEVGAGIVPLDPAQRAWREQVGALSQRLASRADTVVRMVCGIPVVVKGDLAPETIRFVMIRHAQTPGNEMRRYVGSTDEPLSDKGRLCAQASQAFPEVRRVYVSNKRRTQETAAIMFSNAEQVVIEGIEEMDFGVFEGRSAAEMADDAAYTVWVDGNCEGECPGGESRDGFTDRVCAAIAELCFDARARGERQVYVVAHGGTMMATFSRFADESRTYYEWIAGNGQGYRAQVVFDDENASLVMHDVRLLDEAPTTGEASTSCEAPAACETVLAGEAPTA